ncbi:hypothetical protein M422DRAFT_269110 [Sphaerobolus stellatus SS14]|uniref:Uncharacterized protein n=1 Tax=Sphaerobolus stellatus (strain SS14) TaxID=990650 RepID=A0A0C9UWF3_SPHS4|nr:hypothetical protein M422DRAFT_269110 [Sphaerobolus stellatus SS14]
MSTRTQAVSCASTTPQPKSDPRFLTAQDQHADHQHRTQSRGLIDSQGQPLGPLPSSTRTRRPMPGMTDASGTPGQPPGDNPRDNDNSDHGESSPHPSCGNSPQGRPGEGAGPPDDSDGGDNDDGDPPADPPPDGDNSADDIRREL